MNCSSPPLKISKSRVFGGYRFLSVTGLLWIVAVSLAGNQAVADTVDTKSGRGYRGKVTDMNANSVTVTTTNGKAEKIIAGDITRITFDGEPNGLRTARRSVTEGQFNRVEEMLSSVQPANTLQRIEKEFLIAMASAQLALRGEGGKSISDARQALSDFVANRDNTIWYQFFSALERFGDLEVASGNLDNAIAQYSLLSKSSSPEIQLTGQFKAAKVNVLRGQFTEAKTAFEEVQKAEANDPGAIRMKLLAKVGSARCDAEAGQATAAIKEILDVIKSEDPSDMLLFGRAYNALGHAYLKDGQKKAALLAFLHTDVLYQRDAEIHAEALYQLVSLWQQDQKPTQSLEAKKMLTEKYRNTFWGNKAQAGRF